MRAGRGREEAAREVAKVLKHDPVLAGTRGEEWRAVARWRDEIVSPARWPAERREASDMQGQAIGFRTQAAGQYNSIVNGAQRLIDAGEALPASLVEVAHYQLAYGIGMSRYREFRKGRAISERGAG